MSCSGLWEALTKKAQKIEDENMKKQQKQQYPPFCPEHTNKSRTRINNDKDVTCLRPEPCRVCQREHVDQATDPRPECLKYDQSKPGAI